MPTEEGVIEDIRGRKAMIRIQKSSHCASCGSRDSCGVHGNQERIIELTNSLQALTGDRVEISIPEGSLLKLSFLVYFMPILALVIGALLGDSLARFAGSPSSLPPVLGGAVALFISFYGLKKVDQKRGVKRRLEPRMTRILSSGAPPQSVGSI